MEGAKPPFERGLLQESPSFVSLGSDIYFPTAEGRGNYQHNSATDSAGRQSQSISVTKQSSGTVVNFQNLANDSDLSNGSDDSIITDKVSSASDDPEANEFFSNEKKKRDIFRSRSRVYEFGVKWLTRCGVGTGPLTNFKLAIATIIYFTFFFITGITLILTSSADLQCRKDYVLGSNPPAQGSSSMLTVKITSSDCAWWGGANGELIELPPASINIYYNQRFNQNELTYFTSKSASQLKGTVLTQKRDVAECYPKDTRTIGGVQKVLHPCGLMAWSLPLLKLRVFKSASQGTLKGEEVKIDQSPGSINWSADISGRYSNPTAQQLDTYRDKVFFWMMPSETKDLNLADTDLSEREKSLVKFVSVGLTYEEAGIAVENSHFIAWMRPSAFSFSKKLYGRFQGPLKLPFFLQLELFAPSSSFSKEGTIFFSFSSNSFPGGPRNNLGITVMILAALAVLFHALHVTFLRKHLENLHCDVRWLLNAADIE